MDAASIASNEPNSRANDCAAVGPTCLMDRATITLHKGFDLASARAVINRSAIAPRVPSFFVKNSDVERSARVIAKSPLSSFKIPSASKALAAS